MIKNTCKDCLTIIWLTVLIILGGCGHTTDANLTGFCIITGNEKGPSNSEEVIIYRKSHVPITAQAYLIKGTLVEVSEREEDFASLPQLPESYEYIGYVEGIKQLKTPENVELTHSIILNLWKECSSHALELMRQNATKIGANGVVLTNINYERGYSDSDHHLCVAAGWAVHVTPEDFSSINKEKKEKCGEFQIYIDAPKKYEVLGVVSSNQEFEYLRAYTTPSQAIKKGFEDLKQKVIKMGGNGLYIKSIVRNEKVDEYTILFDALFGSLLSDTSTVLYLKYYVMSGHAIKVLFGDEMVSLPFQNLYKDDPDHHLFPYKVTKLYFPRYTGEVALLVGEEPEEDSFYVLHFTARTNKLNKEELLYWMRAHAAEHGANTIILDEADPKVYDSGILYWTARAYRTKNMEKTQ
jgi:uncharacterized protein YbjQ (UPF0145 family)